MNRLALPRLVVLLAVAPPSTLAAQGPPGTDVWVAPLSHAGRRLVLGRPVNVTQRAGYDNQPAFLPDGTGLWFTRIGADSQADVWRYDFAAHAARQLIATPESEYSPTPIPGTGDISVVRVERDSTQRLWRFDADGGDPGLVLERLKPVGYHAWAGPRTVAVYVLGNPNALVLARPGTGRADTVARNIGRSLQSIPGRRAVSFVQRVDSTRAWLMELDGGSGTVRRLVELPRGAEYHAWTPDGVVLTSDGATLYQWDPRGAAGWLPVADLAGRGLRAVTRLAVSPAGDRLAIVADDASP